MTIRRITYVIALLASALGAAETRIEFAGVLTAEGKTRLALTDTDKKVTTWVEPGQEFNGYTIARYDAKEDAVFLTKGGEETRLGLVAAKTADAPSPAATIGNSAAAETAATAIRSNLRQLATAARQYQLAHGVTTVSYTDLVGPDKLIKELKPVAGENYSTLSFGPAVTGVNVTTANGMTVSMDVTSASTTTPAERAPAPVQAAAAPAPPAPPAAAQSNATTETATPTGRQPASPTYTIKGGDTWQKISEATGVPVSQLKQMNPTILEGSALPSGQTIRVR